MTTVAVDGRRITPELGLELTSFRMVEALDNPEVAASIQELFVQHRVLVLRNQSIDRETHKAFGRLFGDLHVHPSQRTLGVGGDPEIFTVRTGDAGHRVNGGRWHMDVSCEEIPPRASILRLLEAPAVGGDTLFADMHRAFEWLSEPLRRLLGELDAVHDGLRDLLWYGVRPKAGQTYPSAVHPMVVAHPDSGRPTLFVNEGFTGAINGLQDIESDALLAMLFAWVARTPALHCRVCWEPGTVVMWDNRAVQHHAIWDYEPHGRHGERVTVMATERPRRWAGSAPGFGNVAD